MPSRKTLLPALLALLLCGWQYQTGTGPYYLWHMNEGTGTTSKEELTNVPYMNLSNAAWVDGRFGKGLYFNDALNSFAYSNTNIYAANTTHTVVFAFKKPSAATDIEIWVSAYGSNYQELNLIGFGCGAGVLSPSCDKIGAQGLRPGTAWRGSMVYCNTPVTDGKWHHIAFARNGTTMTCYRDGANDTGGSGYMSNTTTANKLAVGANVIGGAAQATISATGYMDEVLFYNTTLTAAEVKRLYDHWRGHYATRIN